MEVVVSEGEAQMTCCALVLTRAHQQHPGGWKEHKYLEGVWCFTDNAALVLSDPYVLLAAIHVFNTGPCPPALPPS